MGTLMVGADGRGAPRSHPSWSPVSPSPDLRRLRPVWVRSGTLRLTSGPSPSLQGSHGGALASEAGSWVRAAHSSRFSDLERFGKGTSTLRVGPSLSVQGRGPTSCRVIGRWTVRSRTDWCGHGKRNKRSVTMSFSLHTLLGRSLC